MLDKKDFEKIRKDMDAFEAKREEVIQKSREIIHISKRIIYALHRNDLKSADLYAKEIKNKKENLGSLRIRFDTNIDQTALQEYAEALCYYYFIKDKEIPTASSLKIDNESYLMGLCDLTGELMRKAVNEAISQNFSQVVKIKELVDEIYSEFLKFNLRNSELRKKSDQIKWNLQKLEDMVFELKIKGRLE